MTTRLRYPLFLAALAAAGCGEHHFEPPDKGEQVRLAAAVYAPALFDSVAWTSDQERETVGNAVYIDSCRKCHGPAGRGETDYARQRGLEIPSLVEPEWPRAVADSLHRLIFVGHENGMPVEGNGKLSPREIDAVAWYVLQVLRPDAMRESGG